MDDKALPHGAALAAFGLAAGFAGAVAMSLSQKAEMAMSGRPPSNTPAEAVEAVTGMGRQDAQSERQLSTAAHLAFGTGLGLGMAALAGVPEPARGLAFFTAAWTAGNTLVTRLGLSDPPSEWSAKQLATDIGHHAVYATATAATFAALRRIARV